MTPGEVLEYIKTKIPTLEAREYQGRIISKTVKSFLEEGVRSIMLESPTGSGKTAMSLVALRIMQESQKLTFGWGAMRRKLLSQAKKENDRIGVKDIRFFSMFDKDIPKCDIIICDEAQHDAAATCANVHKTSGAKLSLGMTATPFRTDRMKLAYEKVISDCGVRFLIEQNYLSNFNQYVIKKWTPEDVTTRYLNEQEKWGKSVMFFNDKDLCNQTNEILVAAGVKSAVITGSCSAKEQEKLHEQFENGELQVLINIFLLCEGFDAPDLQTVFVRDSTKGPVMQMTGRVLRKDPNNPEKVANVVQSEETRWSYSKTARAKMEYVWDDEGGNDWRSITPGKQVSVVAQNVLEMMRGKEIVLPGIMRARSANSASISKDGEVKITKRSIPKQMEMFPDPTGADIEEEEEDEEGGF